MLKLETKIYGIPWACSNRRQRIDKFIEVSLKTYPMRFGKKIYFAVFFHPPPTLNSTFIIRLIEGGHLIQEKSYHGIPRDC